MKRLELASGGLVACLTAIAFLVSASFSTTVWKVEDLEALACAPKRQQPIAQAGKKKKEGADEGTTIEKINEGLDKAKPWVDGAKKAGGLLKTLGGIFKGGSLMSPNGDLKISGIKVANNKHGRRAIHTYQVPLHYPYLYIMDAFEDLTCANQSVSETYIEVECVLTRVDGLEITSSVSATINPDGSTNFSFYNLGTPYLSGIAFMLGVSLDYEIDLLRSVRPDDFNEHFSEEAGDPDAEELILLIHAMESDFSV